jgi:hypothetical protein
MQSITPLFLKKYSPLNFGICLIFILISINPIKSQVSYGSQAAYSLRKIVPTYAGSAIQIRRACDNATVNVGFNSCGGLDTTAMKEFVTASNPLSAISSAAAAAFSLRKLRCAYAGSAIRIRSTAVGSPTVDVGFTTNGDLDTTAMKTFVGANSAFVTIWYDQSGNGRNATQAATGSQPRIVNAGVIEYQNNMPSIRFLGLGYGLATAAFDVFDAAACFNGVAKVNTNLTYNAIVSKTGAGGSNNIPAPLDFYNNQVIVGNGAAAAFFTTSQTFNAAQPMGVWTIQSQLAGNKTAFFNGSSILNSAGAATHVDVNRPLHIGARNDAVTGLNGWISEVITFSALPSTTDRAFLEWTQGQYYNISGISLGTVPVGAANGFIVTWYDQSGNGRNATQAATANQPKIINAGKISTQNGLPAIALDGTSTWLIQSTLAVTNPYSLNAVATRTVNGGAGGYQRLININATGDASGYLGVLSGNYATFTGNSVATWNDITANLPNTSVALNAQGILSMNASTGATGLVPYVNGTAQNTKVGTMAATTGFLIGAAWSTNNTSQLWPGSISEFHIFSSALSTTRRTLLETNQAANYARTISNNKYTPPTATSYILYVNGVGRESTTDSVAGTRSTVGMGISVGTGAGDFLKDNGDYITYGINCPVSSTVSIANLPAPVQQRWNNDWYLNKTDVGTNNGTLSIYFDFSDFGITGLMPGVASNYVLLRRSTAAGTFSIVGTTTASVVGDRVIFATDASTITTNNFYTIGTMNALASPLPIELVSFTCNLINTKTVELNWTTSTEINTDYFSIERSSDGVTFESIGKVTSAGNSLNTLNYSLSDEFALKDVSYYRLKSVDLNGSYKYSEICSVTNYNASSSIIIYPNPTNGSISVECNQPNSLKTDALSLKDITGKAIEVSIMSINNKIIIDMSILQPGMYFLEVMFGNKKIVEKITLQK